MSNFNAFKVGDVCVVIAHPDIRRQNQKFIGCEVTLMGPPNRRGYWPTDLMADGVGIQIRGDALRLKRPPSTDDFTAGEWELCPWRPKRVEA